MIISWMMSTGRMMMRCFKIWDMDAKVYVVRQGSCSSTAAQSCWDTESSAKRVAGRLCKRYNIHTFKMERVYTNTDKE